AQRSTRLGVTLIVVSTPTYAVGHTHSHGPPLVSERTLRSALVLTLVFVAVEAICGWYGPSLALLSDAGHNLADAAALGLSWYALHASGKPSHEGMTFGYHRVGVFAALGNVASLLAIAVVILWEAVARIRQPEETNGIAMVAVAAAAI